MNPLLQLIQGIPIQAWVIILVFVFSAIGQIGKSLSTMKQKRRLEQERQKRIAEAMRTGRPVPDPAAEQQSEIEARRQRLAEMQARRQAQLDELRKRRQEMIERAANQQGRPQSGAQSRVSTPPGGAGQPARRVGAPVPTRSPQGRAGTRPSARPTPRPAPAHPSSHSVSQASAIPTTIGGQPGTHGTIHVSEDLGTLGGHKLDTDLQLGAVSQPFQHALHDAPPTGPTGLARHGIELKGREDLRRALILAEILERPVSMRPDRLEAFE